MARVRVGSLEDMLNDIKDFKKEVERGSEKLLGNCSVAIIDEAKKLTPVDTGELINSYEWSVEGKKAVVSNDREYFPYVEFGDCNRHNMNGHYMLKRGITNAEEAINSILEEFAKEAFE